MRWAPLLICASALIRLSYLLIWDFNSDCSRVQLEVFYWVRYVAGLPSDAVMFGYALSLLKSSLRPEGNGNQVTDNSFVYRLFLGSYVVFIVVYRFVLETYRFSVYGSSSGKDETAYYASTAYAIDYSLFILTHVLIFIPFIIALYKLFRSKNNNNARSRNKVAFLLHTGLITLMIISSAIRCVLLMNRFKDSEPNDRQEIRQKKHPFCN